MTTLKVTAEGQATLEKAVLALIGARAGDLLEIDLTPDGRVLVSRSSRQGRILADLAGMLKDDTDLTLTTQEMDEIIAKGWAGQLEDHG